MAQSAEAEAAEVERTTSGSWMRISMFAAACATVAFMLYMVWMSELGEFAQGVITLILGRFLGYIDGMYSFEFATNRGSARKDETIKDLATKASTPHVRSSDVVLSDEAAKKIAQDIATDGVKPVPTKICTNCQTPNPPDALFCRNCGTKL